MTYGPMTQGNVASVRLYLQQKAIKIRELTGLLYITQESAQHF
jgi:hypothetical protein